MALFGFFKAEPTDYVIASSNGRIFREGAGRAFWYLRPTTSIALLPTATVDTLFALSELTGNFQPVTLQGQITYRIAAPRTAATLLNFTIDPQTRAYRSEDPTKLSQRIVNLVQAQLRAELRSLTLEVALLSAESIARTVLERTRAEPALAALGVECVSLFVTAIKTTPEMTKALEAEYREALQKRADHAIYDRRAEAVERELRIKQNELSTSVDLEQRRRELVDLQGANARSEATFEAEALQLRLAPYQGFDQRTLMALAFRDFASNAEKIGTLTITSEILADLLRQPPAAA